MLAYSSSGLQVDMAFLLILFVLFYHTNHNTANNVSSICWFVFWSNYIVYSSVVFCFAFWSNHILQFSLFYGKGNYIFLIFFLKFFFECRIYEESYEWESFFKILSLDTLDSLRFYLDSLRFYLAQIPFHWSLVEDMSC